MKNARKTKVILLTEEIKAVENTLRTWGTLTLLESGGNLSFFSENALQNLSKFGIKISGGKKEVRWPTTIECADQLINQLNKYKPKWAQAIKWHYTEPDSPREQAERHHLSKSIPLANEDAKWCKFKQWWRSVLSLSLRDCVSNKNYVH